VCECVCVSVCVSVRVCLGGLSVLVHFCECIYVRAYVCDCVIDLCMFMCVCVCVCSSTHVVEYVCV